MERKKIWIAPGILAAAVTLTAAGVTTAFAGSPSSTHHQDTPLTGSTLAQASAAATKAAGGGTVTDSHTSDENGSAYEVQVTKTNGTHVDVHLSKSFAVVKKETDTETKDASDRPLTGSTLTQVSAAAVKAAGGGTVTDSHTSDEIGSAYVVQVTETNGTQVDVHLNKSFAVVKKETDTQG